MTKENELIPHTFSNGVTVMIKRVSPLLIMELRKANPEPQPPMQKTELGMEANPAHPEYKATLEKYQFELEDKIRRLLIKRGVVCNVPRDEVDELREFWREEFGMELDKDDLVVYISFICCDSEDELGDLTTKITRKGQPTEAEIKNGIDQFRS